LLYSVFDGTSISYTLIASDEEQSVMTKTKTNASWYQNYCALSARHEQIQ